MNKLVIASLVVSMVTGSLLSGCVAYEPNSETVGTRGDGYRDRDGMYRDRDRDGIRDRADRDRDGDGVRNRDDRRPDNPRRY